jgi:hypothetical protein
VSTESLPRIKSERTPIAGAAQTRSVRRIVAGILFACAYIGILAGAGFFISNAVNSMGDTTAMARATIAQIRETTHETLPSDTTPDTLAPTPITDDSASVAASPAPVADVPAAALSAPPAATPDSAPAMDASAPESPRHSNALADLVQSIAAPVGPTAESADPNTAPVAPLAALATTPAPPPAIAEPFTPARAPAVVASAEPAAPPAPPSPVASVAAPVVAAAPDAPTSELEAQGDERLYQGDLASARLFYERAASDGNARAARRLGNSFDPAFLARWGVRGMRGDPAAAAQWYRRASALGDHEAEQDLAALPQH